MQGSDKEWMLTRYLEAMKAKQTHGVFVDQMYGYETSYRRNQALKVRKELMEKKRIGKGYAKYPAKLFVMKVGDNKYTFYEDFSELEVPETNTKVKHDE